ncbi:MAG: hypothetical protein ACKOQO_03370 [Candidatus Limnocylindrus sp.]
MKPHNSIRRVLIVSLTIGTLAFTPTNVRAADPIVTVIDGTDMTVVKQTTSGPTESFGTWGAARSDFFQAVVVYVPVTPAAGMRSTISFDYSVLATGGGLKVGGTMACEQSSILNNNRQFRVDIVEPWLTGQSWFGSPALGLLKNALTPVANSSGRIDVDVTAWAGTTVNLAFRATGCDDMEAVGNILPTWSNVTLTTTDFWVDAPAVSVKPVITGDFAAVGVELTGTRGTWTSISAYFRPQWYRCTKAGAAVNQYTPAAAPSGCTAISGATELTYTPVTADRGKYLRMRSGGTGDGGQLFSFSKTTAVIGTAPVSRTSAPPTVGGVLRVGRTLTATKGTWTATPTATYRYQWYRCTATGVAAATVPDTCTVIAGATKSTYKLVAADKVAGYIRVKVTATSTAGVTMRLSAAKKIQ